MLKYLGKRFPRRNSILFVCPDYHCSFFYRDEFRNLGWKADIYVPWTYPQQFLFDDVGIKRCPRIVGSNKYANTINYFLYSLWMCLAAFKYNHFVFYGKVRTPYSLKRIRKIMSRTDKRIFIPEIAFLKILRKALVFIPSGCNDEYSQDQFRGFDGGKVCGNCGFQSRCNDSVNTFYFEIVKKYFNASISTAPGFFQSPNFKTLDLKYKVIDFSYFDPKMKIPQQFLWKSTGAIRILHAASLESRSEEGKNIKGTPYIHAAIDQLKLEGYDIDFLHVQGVASKDMRYYQVQADLIIDQLIYGLWGSSGIEALALGKPLVCYLRPSWRRRFMDTFGYTKLPIIEATTDSIYSVLKHLLDDRDGLEQIARESYQFARHHYNLRENTLTFMDALEKIRSEN